MAAWLPAVTEVNVLNRLERPSQPFQTAILEEKWNDTIPIASVDEGVRHFSLDPPVSYSGTCPHDDQPVTALKCSADATVPILTVYEMLTAEPVLDAVFSQ